MHLCSIFPWISQEIERWDGKASFTNALLQKVFELIPIGNSDLPAQFWFHSRRSRIPATEELRSNFNIPSVLRVSHFIQPPGTLANGTPLLRHLPILMNILDKVKDSANAIWHFRVISLVRASILPPQDIPSSGWPSPSIPFQRFNRSTSVPREISRQLTDFSAGICRSHCSSGIMPMFFLFRCIR